MGSRLLGRDDSGKKDDDHRPPNSSSRWAAATGGSRRNTLRRLAIVLAVGVFVYLFIHNLPTDVPIRDLRHPVYKPGASGDGGNRVPGPMPKLKPGRKPHRPGYPPPKPAAPPAQPAPEVAVSSRSYNGPLVFPELLRSLEAIYSTDGMHQSNKNVLFAAASLKSAALLLPMACLMGGELTNYVHFALVGGSVIGVDELRALNGVDESCQVIFHDARPDFALTSTLERLKLSSGRALYHINKYMHPQALIVDASGVEEDYFLSGIRKQASISKVPLIELPEHAHSRLSWISKLDSSSLAAWDKFNVEILVHAFPGTSSIVHLLKSLSVADFSGGPTPHLTIELPPDVDRATTEFLKTFDWPPHRSHSPSHPRQLTLRHRIPRDRLTEEESSVRFLESFWPSSSKYSHVLVLSPQTQLSPQFFHYLRYTALHYLYSAPAQTQEWESRLLGISLHLPSTRLDSSTPFTPPSGKGATASPTQTPFLWQAPNANAALLTGQKWTELHALISRSLDYQQHHSQHHPAGTDTKSDTSTLARFFTDKRVSKHHPSWLEHALRLARARGYWMLYPGAATAKELGTVHGELYRAPEEYASELDDNKEEGGGAAGRGRDAELPLAASRGNALFESLPERGRLLAFDEMPLLLWDGTAVTGLEEVDGAAAAYADEFRRAVGGCGALRADELVARPSMGDLFCIRE